MKTKFYVIMKFTFSSKNDLLLYKRSRNTMIPKREEYADGDGSQGTNGNPDNHFPSIRIKMHELQKSEKDPLVLYTILSTDY